LCIGKRRSHPSQGQQDQPVARPQNAASAHAASGGTLPCPAARGRFTVKPLKKPHEHTHPDCDSGIGFRHCLSLSSSSSEEVLVRFHWNQMCETRSFRDWNWFGL
jgi:hypothetical protein